MMNTLIKFESLAKKAIFLSNKDSIFQSVDLLDTLKASNNQKIRAGLSHNSKQFADMSRVVR